MKIRKSARREDRVKNHRDGLIGVQVRHQESADRFVAAELINISRGGARLLLTESMQFQQAVTIVLQSEKLQLHLELTAEICWSRPDGDGHWLLGISFVPKLPDESLEKLFESGLLERRTFRREPTRIPVTARWELESADSPAILWDVSEGGFCILTHQPRRPGHRVMVCSELGDTPIEIAAKSQWEMQVGGGYVVGCEFTTKDGRELTRRLQALGPQPKAAAPISPERSFVRTAFRRLVDTVLRSASVERV